MFTSIFLLLSGGLALYGIVNYATQGSLLSTTSDIFSAILDGVPSLFHFVLSLQEFFSNMIKILPSTFSSLFQVFLVLLIAIFLWKFFKGGG